MTKNKWLGFDYSKVPDSMLNGKIMGTVTIADELLEPCVPVTEVKKDYVSVVVVKETIEYLINWGKFQQTTNEIYRHSTDSLNELWIEKLEQSLRKLGLSEKKD